MPNPSTTCRGDRQSSGHVLGHPAPLMAAPPGGFCGRVVGGGSRQRARNVRATRRGARGAFAPSPLSRRGAAGYASLTRRSAGVCYTSGDGGLGPRVRLPARATVFRGVTRRSTGCRAGFSVNLGRESHVDQSVNGTVSDHVVNGYPPVNPPPPAMSRPTRASTRPECLP